MYNDQSHFETMLVIRVIQKNSSYRIRVMSILIKSKIRVKNSGISMKKIIFRYRFLSNIFVILSAFPLFALSSNFLLIDICIQLV